MGVVSFHISHIVQRQLRLQPILQRMEAKHKLLSHSFKNFNKINSLQKNNTIIHHTQLFEKQQQQIILFLTVPLGSVP